jgi:hypothetical protein
LRLHKYIVVALFSAVSLGWAQTDQKPVAKAPKNKPSPQATPTPAQQKKIGARQKFVIDVVKSAVALPQPDPQDRLRVLATAANVALPVDPAMSKQLAK